jgi:hypothetical protein
MYKEYKNYMKSVFSGIYFLIMNILFIILIPIIVPIDFFLWNGGICRRCHDKLELCDFNSDRMWQIWKCKSCPKKVTIFLEREEISDLKKIKQGRESKLKKIGI